MYGRNELIARHIKMRTGKTRTRKQVSSHIQVLARRKAKAETSTNSFGISPTPSGVGENQSHSESGGYDNNAELARCYDIWNDRPIVTQKIRLVEFSAFIEYPATSLDSGIESSVPIQTNVNQTVHHDIRLQTMAQQPLVTPTYPGVAPQQQTHAYPLTSNQQLTAQFNQATYVPNADQQQYQSQATLALTVSSQQSSTPSQALNTSSAFVRHSYVKISYSDPQDHQISDRYIENIDISQIVDKFPEIGGTEGLFQRGPSDAFFLVKFWADLNNDHELDIDDQNSFFGFSSHLETSEPYRDITCSTKVCSYGLQVVEKVEKIYRSLDSPNGHHSFKINRSPMCEFMIQFIRKLRQLPRVSQMNSVLENFTVLQVITSESTSEILLCLAYVFEVAPRVEQVNAPQCHVYKLTRN